MGLGDEPGVKGSKRGDVTLRFDEVAVGSVGLHTQTMPSHLVSLRASSCPSWLNSSEGLTL